MANYHVRQREPLLDSDTRAYLERRGKELLGLALLGFGIVMAMILGSYSPDDPSWLSVTDAPARNLMGRFGAGIASPLYVVVGLGAWCIALIFLVWGARFALHRGSERALSRLAFAPVAVALTSVFASANAPTSAWTHTFGLGGLFGDTALGAILEIVPGSSALGLDATGLAAAAAAAAVGFHVLGFTLSELFAIARSAGEGAFFAMMRVKRGIENFAAGTIQEMTANRARAGERGATGSPLAAPAGDAMENDVEPPEETAGERTADDVGNQKRHSSPIHRATRAEPPPLRPFGPEPVLTDLEIEMRDEMEKRAAGFPQEPPLTPLPRMRSANPDSDADDAYSSSTLEKERGHEMDASPLRSGAVGQARQSALQADEGVPYFENPPLSLLSDPIESRDNRLSEEALAQNARTLESVLDDYGVKGEITSVRPGPVVTMYELEPAPGLKASRVIGLADDIARSMSSLSARVSTVPGRNVIGIELPNATREKVVLREILATGDFGDANLRLPLALGKDIGGVPVVANLAQMPHLLIAGTTGSGKSVAINTMILSILYKLSPEECRLIMIDPKMLELSVYDGIPHLLSPVVTDPKKAVVALKWAVVEMEKRYRKMSKMGVRNIEGYNGRVRDALSKDETFSRTVQTGFDDATGEPIYETEEFQPETLPYIVVIVDEMADLMMVAGKDIEACIQRLAQMARASGIHLIMATQRPSVDVITGTIKANFPTRISFHVTSKVDSRTILGEQGAEQLLGMGDMLFMAGGSKIARVHGPFVSDEEVEEVVRFLKRFGPPNYATDVAEEPEDGIDSDISAVLGLSASDGAGGADALYDMAVQIVAKDRKCSTSYIQRKLSIGYNKAARLVEQMEEQGLVSSANHVGKREILMPESQ